MKLIFIVIFSGMALLFEQSDKKINSNDEILKTSQTITKQNIDMTNSDSVLQGKFYTHALWHVKEGKVEDFILAWKKFGLTLSQIPDSPPVQGTLIQSLTDPLVFYSFGPWETLDDIQAMRNDEPTRKAMAEIIALCVEARPATYKTVLKLSYPGTRKG